MTRAGVGDDRSSREGALRVGLIGYGLGGAVFHAPLIRSTPGLVLHFIVTSDPERRASAAAANPTAQILTTVDDLWQRSDEFDIAVIASPNRTHVPLALTALSRGLAVVVDKPIAARAAEARALEAEAWRRKLFLTVFQNRRWDGDFLTLQRILREGRLGEVFRFESRFERWRPAPRGGWRERGEADEAGGLLYDLGSHLIDQALVLFGAVSHVYAELDRRRPDVAVEDDVFVALTHASGVRSQLWMSALAARLGPRLRVLGTQGAYEKHGLDGQEDALRAGAAPTADAFGIEPADRWGSASDGLASVPVPTERGAYLEFYAAVSSAIRYGGLPPVAVADAVRTLEVIAAARQSAATAATVALPA